MVTALAFIFTVYLFLKTDLRKCTLISSIFLLCVVLTGSRKSIVLAAAGLFILMLYLYPKKRFRKVMISTAVILFGFLFITKIPFLCEIAGSRIVSTIQYFFTGETPDASMVTRSRLIKIGMEYFSKKPKTGYGLDNFRIITNHSDLYSHNNFVEILFGSGIIGFCIYYSKYVFLLLKHLVLKLKKTDSDYITSKMLFWIFILFTVFEYWFVTYYERGFLMVHIFLLGFMRIYRKNSEKDEIRTDGRYIDFDNKLQSLSLYKK
jgi:O-antigen ligase